MNFTYEELVDMAVGVRKLINDKGYCVDEEEKNKLKDLVKKIHFNQKKALMVEKEEEPKEEEPIQKEEEPIQKPVKTYNPNNWSKKKYKNSFNENTKNPNEKTIRSYFKELKKEQIEEVEKSLKSKGRCFEIEKRICPYDKKYFIVFKWELIDELEHRVLWNNDYSLKWKKCSKYNDYVEFKQ